MTFWNDTPDPTPGWLPGDTGSRAYAALSALSVLPTVVRLLRYMALDAEQTGSAEPGDRLVWLETAIDAIAVRRAEDLTLLGQTPLDRTGLN